MGPRWQVRIVGFRLIGLLGFSYEDCWVVGGSCDIGEGGGRKLYQICSSCIL